MTDAPSYYEQLIPHLEQEEGFRGDTYSDKVGRTTVGWGFNVDDPAVRKAVASVLGRDPLQRLDPETRTIAPPMTREQGAAIREKLIPKYEAATRRYFGDAVFDSLTDGQRASLISMAYNSPRLFGSGLKAALVAGDMSKAAWEIRENTGNHQPWLKGRRSREARAFDLQTASSRVVGR